jgi:hypothetical protein
MFDWIKKLVVEKFLGLGIGWAVSHLATSGLEAHGVTVDAVKLQASIWAAYEALAHAVETKVAETKWAWVGKIL